MTAETFQAEQRLLDPAAPAVVEPSLDTPGAWDVRAGDTRVTRARRDEAETTAYLHGYFNGHLHEDGGPMDRRAKSGRPARARTLSRHATTTTDRDALAVVGEAGDSDALVEAAFVASLRSAAGDLTRAARIEAARGGKYRAKELRDLARQVEGVLDS